MKKIAIFIACISIPLIIGGVSSFFTIDSIKFWYTTLNKPSFNPPNYLFAPVWTIIYILMGVSLFIILNKAKPQNKIKLIGVFGIQLTLNFFWSILFFKFQLIGIALIEIIMMWCSILVMILLFYKTSKLASYLNIPYLIWVTFATILNLSIYLLN